MERLKKVASDLKHKIGKSDSEKLVLSVIKGNEVPLKTSYYTIADMTYSSENFSMVLRVIWENLGPEERDVNKLVKTLQLVDSLVKLAHPCFITELRSNVQKFRAFLDFYNEGRSLDYGGTVRELARKILQMLNNEKALEEERESAKKQRERSVGISSDQYYNKESLKRTENAEGYTGKTSYSAPVNWYDQAKINLGPDQSYVPPVVEANKEGGIDKDREGTGKRQSVTKSDLFSGMSLKQEPQKTKTDMVTGQYGRENREKEIDIFAVSGGMQRNGGEAKIETGGDIFQLALITEKIEVSAPIRKKLTIGELQISSSRPAPKPEISFNEAPQPFPAVFEENLPKQKQPDLFGMPVKAQAPPQAAPNPQHAQKIDPFSFLSSPTETQSKISQPKQPEPVSHDKGKLFGIPLKSNKTEHQASNSHPIFPPGPNSISQPKQSSNATPDYFDLLTLQVKPEASGNVKMTNFQKKEEYHPYSNTFINTDPSMLRMKTEYPYQTQQLFKPVVAYNSSDPFDFNSVYPTLEVANKPQPPKVPMQNLEASLMNIDDLAISLSKSIGPRALDSIEL